MPSAALMYVRMRWRLLSAAQPCCPAAGSGSSSSSSSSHGVLLDLNDGSLRFFKNGVQHGPGYPAGSVTGPVALAAQINVLHRHLSAPAPRRRMAQRARALSRGSRVPKPAVVLARA